MKITGTIIALAGIGIILLVIGASALGTDVYYGKVNFQTEEEYTKFKSAIVEAGGTINPSGTAILSSTPPIIGKFSISVPRGTRFDYGIRDSISGNAGSVMVFVMVVMGAAFLCIGILLYRIQ